jgi:3-hydroxyisobutyrate dehydrogenase-like beta-hydroxyacid dehydrogenase
VSTRWGLVGFGEAGRVIGAALTASGADLAVHDRVLLDPERGPGLAEAVRAAGAQPVDDVAGLADRDVVLSLVTPATALAAAQGYAAVARRGVLYVDLNSTAPQVRRRW